MSKKQVFLQILYFSLSQTICWYYQPLFSFIAFIPIFYLILSNYKYKILQYIILIIILNNIVIFWLYNIDIVKGIISILGNSFVMFIPFFLTIIVKKYIVNYLIAPIFIVFWVIVEYLHHNWFLSFPWLVLGNIFSLNTQYIQWYEYTTLLGGSFWILLCNLIIYYIIYYKDKLTFFIILCCLILFPISLSLILIKNHQQQTKNKSLEVLFLQSTFDTQIIKDKQRMTSIIDLIKSKITKTTDYILLPETIFSENVWETELTQSVQYINLKNILFNYPKTKVIVGASLNKISSQEKSNLKNIFGMWYNKHNVAIEISHNDNINIKEKDFFVPIEEYIPEWLYFMNIPSIYLSKSSSNKHSFDIDKDNSIFIGICYEMVNSFFVRKHIKKNDKIIFMLASEGFFNGSEIGRWQYWNICKLRSIENRKYIVKASNKGYAGVIDSYGNTILLIQPTENKLLKINIKF